MRISKYQPMMSIRCLLKYQLKCYDNLILSDIIKIPCEYQSVKSFMIF